MTTPFWGLYEDIPPPSGTPSVAQVVTSVSPPATTPTPTSEPTPEWPGNSKSMKLVSPALRKKATMVPRSTLNLPTKKHVPHHRDAHTAEGKHLPQPTTTPISALSSYAPIELEGEEYDPAKPNDYDQYLVDKSLIAREERERERERDREQDWERERERERELVAAREKERVIDKGHEKEKEPPKVDLHISGEEAFLRRARLSGRAPAAYAPPVSYHQPDEAPTKVEGDDDNEDIDGMPWDTLSATADSSRHQFSASSRQNTKAPSIAERMMAKMGWKEGSGLGKSEQGITAPLQHKKTDRKSGIIVSAPPVKRPLAPAPTPVTQKAKTVTTIPTETTRVILLRNMVGPGEVDEELESETASECTKYGDVVKCVIHEMPADTPAEEAVRIFVEFHRPESALKAYIDLNGRYFGGRVVSATFYNEERFQNKDFIVELNKP